MIPLYRTPESNDVSKTKHTFAKRQREIEKKRKAEEKRARRREKSQKTDADDSDDEIDGEIENLG